MKLLDAINRALDATVDRVVGETRAAAGCPPDYWYDCVRSGVCNYAGGHAKYRYTVQPGCNVTMTYVGCC